MDKGSSIDRRRFLQYSSACALSPAALASSADDRRAADETPAEPLSVGYRQGEENPAPAAVVPAESLPAGDSTLARCGARITVHGLCGPAERLEACGIHSAELQVLFRCQGSGLCETVEFNPWSFSATRFSRLSGTLDFVVPVDGSRGLDLALDLDQNVTVSDRLRRILTGRGSRRFAAHLSLGRELRRPKLRAGFYLIPLRQDAFRRPEALDGLEVRDEPCLVLSVDAA